MQLCAETWYTSGNSKMTYFSDASLEFFLDAGKRVLETVPQALSIEYRAVNGETFATMTRLDDGSIHVIINR
jgi:uncharacterized protein related to proFAR isomerase